MRYHVTGEVPQRLGTRHPTAVPFQAFETADGHLVLALAWEVPDQWSLLCAELDIIEIADDERFSTGQARAGHHAELEPIMAKAFLADTTDHWVERLLPFGIPCGPLNSIPQVAEMPQVAARGMLVPVEHHTLGTVPLPNTPVRLSRTPGGIRGSSPDMGQHTREVLKELLGLDDPAVDALLESEIVRDHRGEVELA